MGAASKPRFGEADDRAPPDVAAGRQPPQRHRRFARLVGPGQPALGGTPQEVPPCRERCLRRWSSQRYAGARVGRNSAGGSAIPGTMAASTSPRNELRWGFPHRGTLHGGGSLHGGRAPRVPWTARARRGQPFGHPPYGALRRDASWSRRRPSSQEVQEESAVRLEGLSERRREVAFDHVPLGLLVTMPRIGGIRFRPAVRGVVVPVDADSRSPAFKMEGVPAPLDAKTSRRSPVTSQKRSFTTTPDGVRTGSTRWTQTPSSMSPTRSSSS